MKLSSHPPHPLPGSSALLFSAVFLPALTTAACAAVADASNIFNDKNTTFQGRGDRPLDDEIYGVRMAAGVSGSF